MMKKTTKPTIKMAAALMLSTSFGTLAFVATPVAAQGQDYFTAYANSDYNYCDAKLVGAFYGESPAEGKVAIGQFIAEGRADWIEDKLRYSRGDGNNCSWGTDVPHSYNDAVKLGEIWGVDTWDAKSKVAAYYTAGRSQVILNALGSS